MNIRPALVFHAIAAFICALATLPTARADNIPVCVADNTQSVPVLVSDGAGGAIAAWSDRRDGLSLDIYVQHILASGEVDASWPLNGVALHTGPGDEISPVIVTDGAGGAIVTWLANVYGAQHILASGTVDPAWPVNGIGYWWGSIGDPVAMAPDGQGGVIVSGSISGPSSSKDISTLRFLASGVFAPFPWSSGYTCMSSGDQRNPAIARSPGGVYVAWADQRNGPHFEVFAHSVLSSGSIEAGWPANGIPVCTGANNRSQPVMVSAGTGAMIAWQDDRNGSMDIFATRLLPFHSVTVPGGFPVCTAAGFQSVPAIISDGAGGAIVAWHDQRSGNSDIHVQHLLASGLAVDGTWPANGLAVCTAPGAQDGARLASDGASGAIVTWSDLRSGIASDIYAQHVLASGAVDPSWPVDGVPISTAPGNQWLPTIAADGVGRAVIAWQDDRNGNFDVYAQTVSSILVGVPETRVARGFTLEAPWPNPARESVRFRLALPGETRVSVAICDATGRRIRSLVSARLPEASYTWTWDLADDAGRRVRSGLYFAEVVAGGETSTRRFAVVR